MTALEPWEPELRHAFGSVQHAVGLTAFIAKLAAAFSATVKLYPQCMALQLDARGAFDSICRQLSCNKPASCSTLHTAIAQLLARTSSSILITEDGDADSFDHPGGVDQGCPASLAALTEGVQGALSWLRGH